MAGKRDYYEILGVAKNALQNASSIAGLMLTTEVMVTKIEEDEPGNKVQGAVR